MTQSPWWRPFLSRRMLLCILTGFASGLPLFFLFQLVPGWLRDQQVDLGTIGLLSLVQFPYTWKFLWAPLMDRFELPLLGLRRGWMLLTQLGLLLALASFALIDPRQGLGLVVAAAVLVAVFSASQDIVIDAFRREILADSELGLGNAIHINAYRLAGLVPGSLSLILADHLPWSSVFLITAAFMGVGLLLTAIAEEPVHAHHPHNLRQAVLEPFEEFFSRQGARQALLVLAFMVLYKLGDNMAVALQTPFYLDMGYSKSEIGLVAKHAALWPVLIGSLVGGAIMLRIGINRSLWVFGLVQALSIFGYALLSSLAPEQRNLWWLGAVVACEYFGVGLGAAALTAFIAREASRTYLATQLALLTALTAVPRVLANAGTGYMVEAMGWPHFFLLCAVVALPGLLLLPWVAPWARRDDDTVHP
ncbi:AmpG family muropeptide MFS transporter [Gallaecimonas kandeliae]|uniref:AmpG family muropeptide MFS transporter n=1 Tax=Gallaecimonas kandeliae TaxID=3029055 RepID=UPI0026475BC0|nr:AmpG family muropeptide MFS transporter [Gallaecimonas kandeliae]WKE64899.1 AmpG family muropeptide MFS transporter [Gallaecimonas kandeliae]